LIPDSTTYYSNGKLLLTGEYLVLDGALALGVPTKFGQDLTVRPIDGKRIYWKSLDEKGNIWLDTNFELPIHSNKNKEPFIENLLEILKGASELKRNFLIDKACQITTHLTFPKDWGLGSSSTLINNVAQWAKIDAFDLLDKTMGGSGYDIACAQNDKPVLFQLTAAKPIIRPIEFRPIFREQLYFVYLNKKQKSSDEIHRYHSIKDGIPEAVKTVTEITNLLVKTRTLDEFNILISEHEKVVSKVVKLPTIQDSYFRDYFGQMKSLGAWGGDFIMATGNDDTPSYFKKKGFSTILKYDELLLTKD